VSRKANPTIIGGFVLGAIALVVVALAVFGSGKFFVHRPRAVAFFQGGIQGLAVGSAVNLRGVQVGQVTDIQLRLDVQTMQPVIPVYMEFDTSRVQFNSGVSAAELAKQQPLKAAISNGLHARLATQSLVTGQLVVELDLDPNEPRRLVGADPSTVEIPTSQSDIDKLKSALTQLPLDKIAASALKLMQDTDRLVASEDISKLLRSLTSASENLDALIIAARGDLSSLAEDLHNTTGAGRETLAKAQDAMTELRTTLTTADRLLATDGREALRVAVGTLQKAEKTLADADNLVAANSPQRYDLDQALKNLTAITRSLRVFAEDLERRPNAIIVGK
jgi:paraquat-inducible protein B